jgi:hypothetical protein
MVVSGAVILSLSAAAGVLYYLNSQEIASQMSKKDQMIEQLRGTIREGDLQKELEKKASSNVPTTTPTTPVSSPAPVSDATAGWQSYTDSVTGYTVKYPQGWTLDQTDEWVDMGGESKHVRFITIKSWANSAGRISMHWGFVRDNTYLYSTARTGTGAGDFVVMPTNMPVIGAAVTKEKLVFEGKIKEYWYSPAVAPSGYTWEATISFDDQSDYLANDLTGASYVDMAEAILGNITIK